MAGRELAAPPCCDRPGLEIRRSGMKRRWIRRGRADGATGRQADGARAGPTPNPQPRTPVFEIWQDLASKQSEEALREAGAAEAERRLQEQVRLAAQMATLSGAQFQAIE